MVPAATLSLPADLAPSLCQACLQLLEQVGTAAPHPDPREGGGVEHRCHVCRRRGGKVSGHHEGDRIVWVHPTCHRRLHRRREATGRRCT